MSARINMESPTANMFGLEPCPKCGSRYRWPMKSPEVVQCDDCGLQEDALSGFCPACSHAHYYTGNGPACQVCDCNENQVPA